MSVIVSATILYLYMWTCLYFFDGLLKYMSRVNSDYIIQILPSFIVISLFSKIAIHIYPEFLYGEQLLKLIFYLSGIKSLILIVLILIKPFNKSIYYSVMKAIKKDDV